jgi:hypothetical protein
MPSKIIIPIIIKMLNSNDLFNQIGLIVDPKNHYSYQSIDQYKTFLEI